jgi:hypothetical protein
MMGSNNIKFIIMRSYPGFRKINGIKMRNERYSKNTQKPVEMSFKRN